MSAFRRLLRTSAARYAVPVGTALAAGRLLFASWSPGSWADTTLKATSMAVLLLPFVMFAGTQDGRRLLRAEAQPSAVAGARAPSAVVAHVMAAVSMWGLAGYLLILLTGYAAPARLNPIWPPPIPLTWILAGSAAVVCYAALGVLVGRLLPRLPGLALCGLLGFLLPVVLGSEVDWAPALFTIANDGFLGGPAAPRTATLLLQGLFFGLTGLLAITVAAWLVRRGTTVLATALALALLVATSGVALVAVGRSKTVWLVDAAGPRSCSDDHVICLWTDHRTLLTEYALVGRRMLAGAPPGVAVHGWTETGLSRPPTHAEVYLAAAQPGSTNIAFALASGMIEKVKSSRASGEGVDPAQVWLAAHGLHGPDRDAFIDIYGSAELRSLLATPVDRQWAWFIGSITP